VPSAPPKSTLAYANAHRPWQLYRTVFAALLARCHHVVAQHGRKFRFKNKLLSIDATTIELCASLFDWAKFRRTKGAVKLHLVLGHDGYLPSVAVITDGKQADVKIARRLRFVPGTILVMDRGYLDFTWFGQLTAQGVFFVTRPKHNTAYRVVQVRPFAEQSLVVADEVIELTGQGAERACPYRLRRVEVAVPETGELITLLTNHLEFAATTVAAIYKDRWQIELLFKALKQNLRIKTFVGTSPNALHIQIWTALIAMLVLRYLQLRALPLVAVEPRRALAHESLRASRSLALARQALRTPTRTPAVAPGRVRLRVIRTASRRTRSTKCFHPAQFGAENQVSALLASTNLDSSGLA